MSVLVTGGAGYIGSHMVWNLVDAGEEVIVVDRLSTGFDWAVAPGARLVVADIADRDLLAWIMREHRVDAVIHFAGSIIVPESIAQPLAYYDNNTARTLGLVETAIRCGVKHLIFSSTAAVYAPTDDPLVTEAHRLEPQTPYGLSKLMSEWMLRDAAAAHGITYTALRYFNVAGADPKGRTGPSTIGATNLIKVACETATGGRERMSVFGTDYATPDGSCVRDFIHVSDLVEAHRLSLVRMRAGGGNLVANCGYGRGHSVLEVIAAVDRATGRPTKIDYAARRPGDLACVVADSSLLRRETGWQPSHDDLQHIIDTALAWEAKLPSMRDGADKAGTGRMQLDDVPGLDAVAAVERLPARRRSVASR